MNEPVQYIVFPSGERMVVLPEEEYERLCEAAEELEDLRVLAEGLHRELQGEETLTLEELDEFLEKERQRQSS